VVDIDHQHGVTTGNWQLRVVDGCFDSDDVVELLLLAALLQ